MKKSTKVFTKKKLIDELISIAHRGWIESSRGANHGRPGNVLEDLLGIEENNLPIPNAAEWELKVQRANTASLTTLFHTEPSPQALKFVPQILLPKYGWPHQEAGAKYGKDEMSFRQTISAAGRSDRGFTVEIDMAERRLAISFDSKSVDKRHSDWLASVKKRVGLGELNPQPYWGFDDLAHKAGTKLHNCFYVRAEVAKIKGVEHYRYSEISMLEKFSFDGFLKALQEANLLVDFDARTGHNHGTKFRLRQNILPTLYAKETKIL